MGSRHKTNTLIQQSFVIINTQAMPYLAGADPKIKEVGPSIHIEPGGDWCGSCSCPCAYLALSLVGGSGGMLSQENFEI